MHLFGTFNFLEELIVSHIKRVTGVFVILFVVLSVIVMMLNRPRQREVNTLDDLMQAAKSEVEAHFDQGNLLVFDGLDGANQCHINALMVAKLALQGKKFAELQDDQQRLLLNNFTHSILLRFKTSKGPRRIERLLGIKLSCSMFKDLESIQTDVGREISKQLIESKRVFFDSCQPRMHWDDLAFHDTKINALNLPECFGIQFLLEQVKKHRIWMVLKCKTTCGPDKQVDTFLLAPNQKQMFHVPQDSVSNVLAMHELDQAQPVIVVEGHAKIDPLKDNFVQHCNRLSRLNPASLQLAITAVHMKNSQPEVCVRLPVAVKKEQAFWLQEAEILGVAASNNQTFFIKHMFPDIMANACSRDRLLSPEQNEQIHEEKIEQFVWEI